MQSKHWIASLVIFCGIPGGAAAQPWPVDHNPTYDSRYPTTEAAYTTADAPPRVRALPPVEAPNTAPNEAGEVEMPKVETIEPEPGSFWFGPESWLSFAHWNSGIELGINGTEGNAQSFSFRAGANAKRETERNTFSYNFIYAKTTTGTTSTQHNFLSTARNDRTFGDSPWTLFAINTLEYDEFKAFDMRVVLNGGVGYHLIKNETTTLTGRFGSGVSHEINGPDDRYVPEAVFGIDYKWQLTKRQKMVATIDYLPEWENFNDFRWVTNIGWEVVLDEAANLSMKISMIDRYDSTPSGREPNDFDYAILLLWKM